MKKRLIALSASTVTLALTLTACGGDGDDSDGGKSAASVDISHIHGVGVHPTDGKLYVATHNGVYTPGEKNAPVLVGDRKDDFMGFTITADGTFLASGHPAPGRDAPANLGLIESADTGKTWQDKSLTGEVDFHSLDHAHATVYGYDSTNGLLRVSKDGSTWETRSELKALDLAVSPTDPDTVLATTESGVVRSTDGGKTFGPGAKPVMAFLSWSDAKALYGVDPAGKISVSADGGKTWKETGTAPGGQPQALTAIGAQRLIAATGDGVYESQDGGATFTKRLDVSSGGGH